MGNITLLELHVPDGDIQIGPKSLRGSKSETETETESDTDVSAEASEDGSRPLGLLLVAVGVVAVLAVVATKFLGEDADEELDGFDDEN